MSNHTLHVQTHQVWLTDSDGRGWVPTKPIRSKISWIMNRNHDISSYLSSDRKILVGGWPTPLKNDGVKVSWDDDIPNWNS